MSLHFTFIPLLKIMLLKKNKKMPIKNNVIEKKQKNAYKK